MDTDTANPDPDNAASPDGSAAPAKTSFAWQTLLPISLRTFLATRCFTLWSSVSVVLLSAVLFGLGTWQVARLHQKNALIAHITTQLGQPERDLRLYPPNSDTVWKDLDYRRVVLQGDWLDLHQLKLIPRTYEGQNGYHLLVPLHLANGQIVLINRGWVPDKTELGPTSQANGTIVAGIVRTAPAEKPFGMMDNNPSRGQWAWPDSKAIANAIGVDKIAPVIVYAERSSDKPDDYPIGGQVQLEIRNEHKQYALTWYSLALALLVIWLMASKEKAKAVALEKAENTTDSD